MMAQYMAPYTPMRTHSNLLNDAEMITKEASQKPIFSPNETTNNFLASELMKLLVVLAKTFYFHIESPEKVQTDVVEKHPYVAKNNKLMKAINAFQGIPLRSGQSAHPSEIVTTYFNLLASVYKPKD